MIYLERDWLAENYGSLCIDAVYRIQRMPIFIILGYAVDTRCLKVFDLEDCCLYISSPVFESWFCPGDCAQMQICTR